MTVFNLVTNCVSRESKAIGSVRLSVRSFQLCLLNRLTFELTFCVWGIMNIARLGLKVKVIRQGERSMFNAYVQ